MPSVEPRLSIFASSAMAMLRRRLVVSAAAIVLVGLLLLPSKRDSSHHVPTRSDSVSHRLASALDDTSSTFGRHLSKKPRFPRVKRLVCKLLRKPCAEAPTRGPVTPILSCQQTCRGMNSMHRILLRGKCQRKCVPEQMYERHVGARWKCGACPAPTRAPIITPKAPKASPITFPIAPRPVVAPSAALPPLVQAPNPPMPPYMAPVHLAPAAPKSSLPSPTALAPSDTIAPALLLSNAPIDVPLTAAPWGESPMAPFPVAPRPPESGIQSPTERPAPSAPFASAPAVYSNPVVISPGILPQSAARNQVLDMTPPKLINVVLFQPKVDISTGSASAIVQVVAQDSQSGLVLGEVNATNGPSGDVGWYESTSSTQSVVRFNVTLVFPPFIKGGPYNLSVSLEDDAGNAMAWSSRQLAALQFPSTIQVKNMRPDVTPPRLVAVSAITSTRIVVSTGPWVVQFRVDLEDTMSGVNAVDLSVGRNVSTSQDKTISSGVRRHSFTLNLTFPVDQKPGRYPLTLHVWDFLDNHDEFNEARLAKLGFISWVEVVN